MIMRVALVCVALIMMSPASVPATRKTRETKNSERVDVLLVSLQFVLTAEEEAVEEEELPGQPSATSLHGGALREVKRLLGAVGSSWIRRKRETEEANSTESIPSYLTQSIDSIAALQKAMTQQIVDYLQGND